MDRAGADPTDESLLVRAALSPCASTYRTSCRRRAERKTRDLAGQLAPMGSVVDWALFGKNGCDTAAALAGRLQCAPLLRFLWTQ
jgi:hypothetical protein